MVHSRGGTRRFQPPMAARAVAAGLLLSLLVVPMLGDGALRVSGRRRAVGAGAAPADAAPAVTLTGRGEGPGRGMGQYGALGYAIDHGWSYHQILDHFYGGTTTGHVSSSTTMTVDMTSRDGTDTIVVQERGELGTSPAVPVACTPGAPCSVRIARTGPGHFRVYRGTACSGGAGGWIVAADVAASAVTITSTVPPSETRQDMLQLCEATDTRWLRGNLVAVDTGTSQATVNQLPIEAYVRGVLPRESPAFWGALGNGSGEQALEAQAVATRSYGLADHRSPFAKTCDTASCQLYGGRALQRNGGAFTDLEGTPTYATSDAATLATAGEVRVFVPGGGGPSGTTALTEFSSSTGGYSAGGTFPAVPDEGDATPSNPNHAWSASVPVSEIGPAYGVGADALLSVIVTSRNGLGDLGGRVLTLALTFQNHNITTTGHEFAAALGLRSDWFAVTNSVAGAPYHVLTADGTVYGFGGAAVAGSLATRQVHTRAVGLAEGPGGYWVLTADGAVYAFGAVATFGSVAGLRLNGPPHQIVATPSGRGYWIIASDGGVFSFGDAHFWGSTGARRLNAPIVGVGPSPDGRGYWLLGADGGIFTFGDARFYGSTGNQKLNAPVNAMAVMPDGHGYWLAASDGGFFSFGSATFRGSLPGRGIQATAVGVQASPSGLGYLIATASGQVYGFGDALALGGPADSSATAATVGLAYTR
jgi:hypothetical protein